MHVIKIWGHLPRKCTYSYTYNDWHLISGVLLNPKRLRAMKPELRSPNLKVWNSIYKDNSKFNTHTCKYMHIQTCIHTRNLQYIICFGLILSNFYFFNNIELLFEESKITQFIFQLGYQVGSISTWTST